QQDQDLERGADTLGVTRSGQNLPGVWNAQRIVDRRPALGRGRKAHRQQDQGGQQAPAAGSRASVLHTHARLLRASIVHEFTGPAAPAECEDAPTGPATGPSYPAAAPGWEDRPTGPTPPPPRTRPPHG